MRHSRMMDRLFDRNLRPYNRQTEFFFKDSDLTDCDILEPSMAKPIISKRNDIFLISRPPQWSTEPTSNFS